MRIVELVPIEEPVPPQKYGGVELVVYNLVEEMVRRGHEVYLLAAGDSRTSANLVPIIPQSLRAAYPPEEIDAYRDLVKMIAVPNFLHHIEEIQPDIVHNHFAWRFLPFTKFVSCPIYHTIHGPIDTFHERYVYARCADAFYISISNNQRKAMPELNWIRTIYNGIRVEDFRIGPTKKRDYFAFLGRTSPEKGLREICQMIKKTSHRLKIAAKVDTTDQKYFEQEVQPLIDGQQIEFLGEIGPKEKSDFLGRAKGLLLWLNWEEPFGLVVVEAMACGTPVIVNARGAMPELIQDGKTGFLVETIDEMRRCLDRTSEITPTACRLHVEENFSAQKMTSDYLELAGRLTA